MTRGLLPLMVVCALASSCTDFDGLSKDYLADLGDADLRDLAVAVDGPMSGDFSLAGDMQPNCNDGLVGGGESDVDCGGGCAPCELSRACVSDLDCQTGFCDSGRCELVSGPPSWLPVGTAPTGNQPPIARYDLQVERGPDGNIYAMGGRDGAGNFLQTVERLDESLTWTQTANLSRQRSRFGATATPNNIWLVDGLRDASGSFENSVDRTSKGSVPSWNLASGGVAQNLASAAAVAITDGATTDTVFVFGGDDGTGTVKAGHSFVAGGNTLTAISDMSTPRASLGAALGPDNRIYAMGGMNNGVALATAEAYVTAANTWSNITPLPAPRASAPAVVAPDGRIYCVGGANAQSGAVYSSVVAYRAPTATQAERWATVAALASPRWRHGAAVGIDGRIYIVGGSDLAGLPRVVEAYGPIVALSASTVALNATVQVSGSNFARNTSVVFSLDSAAAAPIGTGTTDGLGVLAATTVKIPAGAATGTTRLYATDARSRYPVSVKLQITN